MLSKAMSVLTRMRYASKSNMPVFTAVFFMTVLDVAFPTNSYFIYVSYLMRVALVALTGFIIYNVMKKFNYESEVYADVFRNVDSYIYKNKKAERVKSSNIYAETTKLYTSIHKRFERYLKMTNKKIKESKAVTQCSYAIYAIGLTTIVLKFS